MKILKWSAIVCVGISVVILAYVLWQLPSTEQITGCITTEMNEVELCPTNKNYVKLTNISPFVKKAILLSEDSLFWTHHGFDWQSMENSFKENMQKGFYKRGGSTITQQLAKNLFLSKEKSLLRKFLEALITLQLENRLTKNQILEKYLNVVELGPDIYGVGPAAKFYFKKSVSQLNPLEASFLAFLLPSPVKYSKSYFKKELTPFARSRIKTILTLLKTVHTITPEEYEKNISTLNNIFKSVAGDEDEPSADDSNENLDLKPVPDAAEPGSIFIEGTSPTQPEEKPPKSLDTLDE